MPAAKGRGGITVKAPSPRSERNSRTFACVSITAASRVAKLERPLPWPANARDRASRFGSNIPGKHRRRSGQGPVKLNSWSKDFGVFNRQYSQRPCFVENACRRRTENIGQSMSVNELQILSDELNIDQPASYVFQIPPSLSPFPWRSRNHFHDIPGNQFRVTRATQCVASNTFRSGLNAGEADTTRARVRAMCSQVQASVS